jgi:acyl carrier protein
VNAEAARALVLSSLAEIAPEVEPSEVPGDADLRTFVDLDSMDVFNLIALLADGSGLEIPDGDVAALTTVDLLVGYLAGRGPDGAPQP